MQKNLRSEIFFQAHRGAIKESLENTLPAFLHAWQFPQAIVETDVRQLADGTLICLHDNTIRRVSMYESKFLDTPIDTIGYDEVKHIELREKIGIPTLREVFELLVDDRKKKLYLEIKSAKLEDVLSLIEKYGVLKQILFVHADQSFLQKLQIYSPDTPRMTWCSGTPEHIVSRFELLASSNFAGLTQVQIHFPTHQNNSNWASDLPEGFLEEALNKTKKEGVTLQVFPQTPTRDIFSYLLGQEVRWFVTDAPASFMKLIEASL